MSVQKIKTTEEFGKLSKSICDEALLIDVPEKAYHADQVFASKSKLWPFHQSPKSFYQTHVTKEIPRKQSSDKMDIGSIVNDVVLLGIPFRAVAKVYPDSCLNKNGDINHKPASKFREDNPGSYFIKPKLVDGIKKAIAAIRSHETVGYWIEKAMDEGNVEKSMAWRCDDTGLLCRSRMDGFCMSNQRDEVMAFDLKVSTRWDKAGFRSQVKILGYWMQDIHYTDGLLKLFDGLHTTFHFIVLNPDPPHQIGIHRVSSETINEAEPIFRQTKLNYKNLMDNHRDQPEFWVDRDETQINEINLNRWDLYGAAN